MTVTMILFQEKKNEEELVKKYPSQFFSPDLLPAPNFDASQVLNSDIFQIQIEGENDISQGIPKLDSIPIDQKQKDSSIDSSPKEKHVGFSNDIQITNDTIVSQDFVKPTNKKDLDTSFQGELSSTPIKKYKRLIKKKDEKNTNDVIYKNIKKKEEDT